MVKTLGTQPKRVQEYPALLEMVTCGMNGVHSHGGKVNLDRSGKCKPYLNPGSLMSNAIVKFIQESSLRDLKLSLQQGLSLSGLKSFHIKKLALTAPLEKLKVLSKHGFDLSGLYRWNIKDLVLDTSAEDLQVLLEYGLDLKTLDSSDVGHLIRRLAMYRPEVLRLVLARVDLVKLIEQDREFILELAGQKLYTQSILDRSQSHPKSLELVMCHLDGIPSQSHTVDSLKFEQCQFLLSSQSKFFQGAHACKYRLPDFAWVIWDLFGNNMSYTYSASDVEHIAPTSCEEVYDTPKDVLVKFTYCSERRSCALVEKHLEIYGKHPIAAAPSSEKINEQGK